MMLITNRSIIYFFIVHIVPHNREYNTKNSLITQNRNRTSQHKLRVEVTFPYHIILTHRQFCIIWLILKVGVNFPYHIILTHRQFCIIWLILCYCTFPYHRILTHRKFCQVLRGWGHISMLWNFDFCIKCLF